MQKEYEYMFKFVIIGSLTVGKSSILKRFTDNQFEDSYSQQLGLISDLNTSSNIVCIDLWWLMRIMWNCKYGIQQGNRDSEASLNLIIKELKP